MALISDSPRSFAQALADRVDPPPWQPEGRPPLLPHQIPPDLPWDMWLLQAGRGAGKTEACARYYAAYMRAHPGYRGRIIAPTFGDAVEACIEGPSGLLTIDPEIRWLASAPGGAKVIWPNGSEALVFGTPSPRDVERLRAGGNRHIDWWEEMAANPQLKNAWAQASMGLRLGDWPHSIASTTPRGTDAYRKIARGVSPDSEPGQERPIGIVTVTRASIDDNPHSNPEWRAKQKAAYGGTTLGRQELEGDLIEDVAGALTKRPWWDLAQRPDGPDSGQVHNWAVGIDPGEPGPQCSQALVAAARTADRELWITRAERSGDGPTDFLKHAIRLAHDLGGMLVVEENWYGAAGMELLESVMRDLGLRVPYESVHVKVGKKIRAQPTALLVEQGHVHVTGTDGTGQLVDEWCSWDQDARSRSPHLIDACVLACSTLSGGGYSGTVETVAPWGGTRHDGAVEWDLDAA